MLVRRHQVEALRVAVLITRDRALAEDIVQAAFLRAYERIDQFDADRPFAPWFLRGVVRDAVKLAPGTGLLLHDQGHEGEAGSPGSAGDFPASFTGEIDRG